MEVLILAAGFGTRLYPNGAPLPKTLININGKLLIEYIFDKIEKLPNIKSVHILTNGKFYLNFLNWIEGDRQHRNFKINLINNFVRGDFESLGAIIDLQTTLKIISKEDILLLAGDNFFGFDLNELIKLSNEKNSSTVGITIVNDIELIKKYCCAKINSQGKIIKFKEKPETPFSNLSTMACFYLLKSDVREIINHNFGKLNNLGEIVSFLCNYKKIYGKVFDEYWYDIGSFKELEKVQRFIKES